jgi:hypothetical protein
MGGSSSVIRGANGREYLLEEEQRGEEEVSSWGEIGYISWDRIYIFDLRSLPTLTRR